jgi:hypothetical protein
LAYLACWHCSRLKRSTISQRCRYDGRGRQATRLDGALDRVLSQILQLAKSGPEAGTGLGRQPIKLLTQLFCRSQLVPRQNLRDISAVRPVRTLKEVAAEQALELQLLKKA